MMENEVKPEGNTPQNYQQPPYAGQYYTQTTKKLYRSTSNKWIAGVCGGLAEHFNMSPKLIRVLWILVTIFSVGVGVVGYIVLWAMVEKYPAYYMAEGPYVTQDGQGRIHYHYYYRTTR
jgi:phage shock protein C